MTTTRLASAVIGLIRERRDNFGHAAGVGMGKELLNDLLVFSGTKPAVAWRHFDHLRCMPRPTVYAKNPLLS
jgi:hypothetical protein